MIVLRGERVLLRTGRPEDAEALVRIRNEPEVTRRWGSADIEEEVREGFIGTDEGFVIEVDGQVVGAIQYQEENDPMYRHAGMDIFLTTSRHGEAWAPKRFGFSPATSSRSGATIALLSTRRPTTRPRSAPTRRHIDQGECR